MIVFLVTLHQILHLKKGVKILGYVFASLAGLILLLWLLIRIPAVQTRLVHYATFQASKTLKTEIKIGSVDFSPFNRFYINEMLVRDQSKDTLVYAGSLKLKITDWFFIKDKITIHYFGLANGYINTKRTDSIWNYNFLNEAFASDKQTASKPSNIALDLKEIELDNIRYHTTDKWRGEDQLISLKRFTLSANQIDIKNNKIALNKILVEEPYFKLNQYEGLRPDSLIPITEPRVEGKLHWNPEQWKITAKSIILKRGEFKSDLNSTAEPLPYFDSEHIDFKNINGSLNNFILSNDTISGEVSLSTKERSGFDVLSLTALMKMDPTEMAFNNLDIKTPYSRIGHSFSMKYKNFTDDMAEFVTNVNLEGDIRESVLDFRDLAFFAPQLKGEKIKLKLDGEVNGPVADLFADNIELDYGEHTFVRGDLHITGLPDTDIAEYRLDNALVASSIADLYKALPILKKNIPLDINAIGKFNYRGNITITEKLIQTKGNLQTAIGGLTTDVKIKNPGEKKMSFELGGSISNFEIGQLLKIDSLEKLSATYLVRSDAKGIGYDATLSSIGFN